MATLTYSRSLHRKITLFALAWLLTGCAGHIAYRDGQQLMADNQVEAGLARLQEATRLSPEDAQYRSAYLRAKETFVNQSLSQADKLALQGQIEPARALYARVLLNDPYNERALAGQRRLDMDVRHATQLAEANALLERKDVAATKAKLATILTEDPNHAGALKLQLALLNEHTQPSAETQLASRYKKPINIEFRDVAIRQIFDVIARTAGVNFLFDKEVKTDQKASIFLKNSTIEAAIHYVLLTNQLEQQILDGNTILIYPNTAAKQKDYQEMVVRSFFLTNADAKTVANTLKTITKTRDIVIDEKLNLLIVRDSAEAIRVAERLVALQDVPEPEVMLEVEILEVKRTRLQQLGMQWPANVGITALPGSSTSSINGTGATGTTGGGSGSTVATTSNGLTLRDLSQLNRGRLGVSLGSATLNANVQDTDANLLANPRIRTRNHEKAKILIGERVPNITTTATATGFVSESINYIDIGLTLNVEPTIYLDNDVAIKVSLEVSNIVSQIKTQSGSTAYEIGTRNASTVLRLKDGETQVLAGLIDDEFRKSGNRVPGVGEVPILGRLFGNQTDDNQKTEIVLSITPHLVRNIQRPDAAQAQFSSGTDSSWRVRPDGVSATATVPTTATATASPAPAGTSAASGGAAAGASQPNPFNSGGAGNAQPTGLAQGNSSTAVNNSTSGVIAGNSDNGGVAGSVAPGSAQITFQGNQQANLGDTVTVSLIMQATQSIASLPMTIGYDNKVLQVVGITEGDFLKQGGGQTSFSSSVTPTGQVVISDTRNGPPSGTSPGQVVSIMFKVIAPNAATQIQLLNTQPVSSAGQTMVVPLPPPFVLRVGP